MLDLRGAENSGRESLVCPTWGSGRGKGRGYAEINCVLTEIFVCAYNTYACMYLYVYNACILSVCTYMLFVYSSPLHVLYIDMLNSRCCVVM